MAKETSEVSTTEATLLVMQRMLEHMDNGRVQQIPLAKARIPTPWNPEGKKNHERPRLSRTTFQNGARVVAERCTEDEIKGFNRLKPGRYGPERKWVVVKRADDSVELRYPNKSVEERMEFGKYTVSTTGVQGILGVLEKVNAEYEERKARRKAGIIPDDEVLD